MSLSLEASSRFFNKRSHAAGSPMTHSDPIPRWECTGRGCRWEYLDDFAAQLRHRCHACGAQMGRQPTQTSILVVDKRRWGDCIIKEMQLQAEEDENQAVNAMADAGWKRGEARQWYRRRAKSHAGVTT